MSVKVQKFYRTFRSIRKLRTRVISWQGIRTYSFENLYELQKDTFVLFTNVRECKALVTIHKIKCNWIVWRPLESVPIRDHEGIVYVWFWVWQFLKGKLLYDWLLESRSPPSTRFSWCKYVVAYRNREPRLSTDTGWKRRDITQIDNTAIALSRPLKASFHQPLVLPPLLTPLLPPYFWRPPPPTTPRCVEHLRHRFCHLPNW